MSKELKDVVTNAAEVSENEEQNEEQSSGDLNKVVVKALFLSAQESAKTKKIGVTILFYDFIDEKGQVRVSMEQKSVKGQNVTVSPVISTWFDPDETKTDPGVFATMKQYLNKGGLCDVYAVVSGNGEFRKIHNFLSNEEMAVYRKLVG